MHIKIGRYAKLQQGNGIGPKAQMETRALTQAKTWRDEGIEQ